MRSCAALVTIAGFAVCESLGATGSSAALQLEPEPTGSDWEFSLSTYTYLAQHARDYANPNLIADREWLHLEARYNYEALKTGSVWLGYNFSTGKKLEFQVTPMLGGVFGDISGIAPGYAILVRYKMLELSTQGEYFFDAGNRSNDFFYSWSELSASPADWFRMGTVVERTQASGNSDVRRGPLVGFKYKNVDLTTYWLKPGSGEATFVFAVTIRL
jgi:hypothetical protein